MLSLVMLEAKLLRVKFAAKPWDVPLSHRPKAKSPAADFNLFMMLRLL
jgi:hypothetical protein